MLGQALNLRMEIVVIVLEVVLLINSISLAYVSTKKTTRILNILLAVLWVVCIIMNLVTFVF